MPVRFPPGRLRLSTRPIRTGSAPCIKTIGIVLVAALAESAPFVLSSTTITDTCRPPDSAASAGSRSFRPCSPQVLDRYILVLDVTGVAQAEAKGGKILAVRFGRCEVKKPDHRHRRLLRARSERPRGC